MSPGKSGYPFLVIVLGWLLFGRRSVLHAVSACWVGMRTDSGPLDTSSHATKGKEYANGTGSLITFNCGKCVNHGVTCTSIFLVLRCITVENQLAVL